MFGSKHIVATGARWGTPSERLLVATGQDGEEWETDEADSQDVDPTAERTQPAASAAALIRLEPSGLSDDRCVMTVSKTPEPVQHETSEWTEILTDSGDAEHVCSEHHFLGAPLRLASRRTANN